MQSLEVISLNIWQVLISLCNLLLIFLILKKFLFKPVKKVLKQFCEALKSSSFGEEVVSVQVAYGTYGEWHRYGKYYGDDGVY